MRLPDSEDRALGVSKGKIETEKEHSLMAKIVLLALALAALTGAPALAQSYDPSVGTGNIVPGSKGGMQSGGYSGQFYNHGPGSRAYGYQSGAYERQ
ncbi:MAG: hypothetical protein WBD87_07505 [Candidatus Acidiferrales bacterium]